MCARVQVPLSYMLPAAAMRALFWARIVLLPLVRCPATLSACPYPAVLRMPDQCRMPMPTRPA